MTRRRAGGPDPILAIALVLITGSPAWANGVTERSSVGRGGVEGNVVAFGSNATNLVPNDANLWSDVLVRVRAP